MRDLISVIITTYNRPDALDAVLRSLARQTDRYFEVLVADDGSGPETVAVVDSWRGRVGRQLIHVWHSHQGFRVAEIRNRGIVAASAPYCVFLDGDCLVRSDFLACHRRFAEPGWFVTGNRILMSRDLSEKILREHLAAERWTVLDWIGQRLSGRVNRLMPLIGLPLGPLRLLLAHNWFGARSCNLGVWRSDLLAVNGFDNGFNGWGFEDSDLFVRLLHAGMRRKDGRMATGVLHLWHPEADRSRLQENRRRLYEVLAGDRVLARHGLSMLGDESSAPTAAR